MFDLSGKGVLITGATGGIGGAIAKAMHDQGANIVLSGTRAERLEELAATLGGDRVHVVPCNLSDRDEVKALIGKADEKVGQVDIVVNNAGITKDNLFMRMKDEEWDNVVEVNLTATFSIMRSALRGMMRRRYGRIINISSISGIIGNPGQANYAATKAGMIGMSKSLAREVAPRGITVNCIAPGFVETPMTEALTEQQTEAISAVIPTKTFGQPEDIASAVVYLASDESAYMTGQTLHINGGMVMV